MATIKSFATLILMASTSFALLASAQNLPGGLANINDSLSRLPGSRTASGILASASDGASRYFAPDGPIQPAITAISGLPMRGGELLNNGITSLSSGLNSGAQRMSRAAGQEGNYRMPGMDTAASMMPASVAQMGDSLRGMIRGKNNMIRGQAESAIQAANRMGESMRRGLSVRSSGPAPMEHASQMMSQVQDTLMRGGQQLKSQLEQSLQGSMGRLQSMRGMGSDLGSQASGYGRTISQGVQGAASQLQQTGRQLVSQIQQNHQKNMSGVSNLMGMHQGNMGQMSSNMQKNFSGLARQASNVAQQLSSSLQSAAQAPLNMIQNLGTSLKGGMSGGGAMSSSGGGRY